MKVAPNVRLWLSATATVRHHDLLSCQTILLSYHSLMLLLLINKSLAPIYLVFLPEHAIRVAVNHQDLSALPLD